MNENSTADTRPTSVSAFGAQRQIPVLLVAWARNGIAATDRCALPTLFVVGRSSSCDLTVRDSSVSKKHFRISCLEDDSYIEDFGSTNGTYLNGSRINGESKLADRSVIRSGEAVFVFLKNGAHILNPPPTRDMGMAGVFHTGPFIRELEDACRSGRPLLIAGPSGTGKELAVRGLRSMLARAEKQTPFIAHNAAQFASTEEAKSTLFGVDKGVFSGVSERAGLIEQADGGVLFLDEVHNLTSEVQRSLLRVLEDSHLKRIGTRNQRQIEVRFVMASNAPGETCGLVHDLFARLRTITLSSLADRVADVPSIFRHVLARAAADQGMDAHFIDTLLIADHYEALCLDGFERDNVRGIVDIADRVVSQVVSGRSFEQALTKVFSERFGTGKVATRFEEQPAPPPKKKNPSSHYERHKALIVALYHQCNGNITAVERHLRRRGIGCSRRWLTEFSTKWGLRNR